jgi:hypothetical protein
MHVPTFLLSSLGFTGERFTQVVDIIVEETGKYTVVTHTYMQPVPWGEAEK